MVKGAWIYLTTYPPAFAVGINLNQQEGNTMISSGYFSINERILEQLSITDAKTFVAEMYNYGGRIGTYEFLKWMQWIEDNHV